MERPIASAFGEQASAYRGYLDSPPGRLREEIAWRRVSCLIERTWGSPPVSIKVLDVGCGTGELALRLATKGFQVVLLDAAKEMCSMAQRQAETLCQSCAHPPRIVHGTVEEASTLFEAGSFDLILCHFLIEYLPDPSPALAAIRRVARPGGLLSMISLNRWQEALRLAIRDHRFAKAQEALTRTTSTDSLFGIQRRAFRREDLKALLEDADFEIEEEGGISIFIDYLAKEAIDDPSSFASLLNLEEEAGKHYPWKDVARYLHLFGRRA